MSKRSRHLLLIVLPLVALSAGKARGQESSYEELHAAYIFNFAKYITWPAQSPAFVIGVYGELEILHFLEAAFKGKRIAGHPTVIKIIHRDEDVLACSIIYVPQSGSKNIKALIVLTTGKNILVVTEDDLIRKGAAISFIVVDNRLKFKLNPQALSASGLSASEGLLKLAILR